MLWYYEKNGQQNGPVSEDELKELVQAGELRESNLVWKQGMEDWKPYTEVFAQEPTSGSGLKLRTPQRQNEPEEAWTTSVTPGATNSGKESTGAEGFYRQAAPGAGKTPGEVRTNAELRKSARDALSGQWFSAARMTAIYVLINMFTSLIPAVGSIVQWLIGGPLLRGYASFFLKSTRGQATDLGNLFSGFGRFWHACGIYIVSGSLILLASFAGAVPGIVLVFLTEDLNAAAGIAFGILVFGAFVGGAYMYIRYAMIYFISNDIPEVGVLETLKASAEMMDGSKKKLMFLTFSFFGWHLLGVLTFGIGLLWSFPYMMSAFAAFYDDLRNER